MAKRVPNLKHFVHISVLSSKRTDECKYTDTKFRAEEFVKVCAQSNQVVCPHVHRIVDYLILYCAPPWCMEEETI